MTSFIITFTVYTLGIIGVLALAFVGAKYFMKVGIIKVNSNNQTFLKVEQALSLEPRKSIYVLKAGTQRFLIAASADNISFLTELNKDNILPVFEQNDAQNVQMHPDLESKLKYINFIKNALNK